MTLTSAKGPNVPRKREHLTCPECGKEFTVSGAEYRYRKKKYGKELCCSKKCGGLQRSKGATA